MLWAPAVVCKSMEMLRASDCCVQEHGDVAGTSCCVQEQDAVGVRARVQGQGNVAGTSCCVQEHGDVAGIRLLCVGAR